nr:UvrD-helicase domain-containing protein [Schlegelella koreensis]
MHRPAYRRAGQTVTREAFYAIACDPARSVVVEACAGAGKTWMLVSRMLRALLEGADPGAILAITFTRKAAGEMRARLGEWLAGMAAGACDDAKRVEELQLRGFDAATAAALAPQLATLHERVLSSGRSVQIRTFHAWFSTLLRAAPIDLLAELGLSADVEVVDDLTDHASGIYRSFHARVATDAALRADFDALIGAHGRFQLRKWLDAALARRNEIGMADAAGTLDPSIPSAHVMWPGVDPRVDPATRLRSVSIHALLTDVARGLCQAKNKTSQKHGALLAAALAVDDDRERFAAAYRALFTDAGSPRQHLAAEGLTEALEVLADVEQAIAQQTAHQEHLAMGRLARALFEETAAYKRARGLADMADLERFGLTLLRDATLAGWVHERLDARIRHVLVDEFQDTSPLQWHALHAWLAGYAGAGGGSSGQRPPAVFIVGDPKQSIYRFRGAEPRVFEQARDFVVEGLGGTLLACDHTRRNAPAVIRAVNAVFERAQGDDQFSGFRPHTTEADAFAGSGVFTLPRVPKAPTARSEPAEERWRDSLTEPREAADEQPDTESQQVAQAIADLLRAGEAEAGDVMVLCRKRESLRLVAGQLAARHLPFAAPEDFSLGDAPEARDLVALLDVLASPRHKLSLAHALRSPLFGASDDDLIELALAAGPRGDWWRALMRIGGVRGGAQVAAEMAATAGERDTAAGEESESPTRSIAAPPSTLRAAGGSSAAAAADALLAVDHRGPGSGADTAPSLDASPSAASDSTAAGSRAAMRSSGAETRRVATRAGPPAAPSTWQQRTLDWEADPEPAQAGKPDDHRDDDRRGAGAEADAAAHSRAPASVARPGADPADAAPQGPVSAPETTAGPVASASPALQRAATLLARWHAAARTLPPHDLLDLVVASGELRERVAAAVPAERRVAALGAIDAVVGLALTLDGARYATPYNFVRALKRRALVVAAPTQSDAVQLLTVHGAKGLEARIVFLVDTDPEPRNADTATVLVDWPVEAQHPTACAFVYSEANPPHSLVPRLALETAAREREEMNALYVAMTRAKERLVVSSTEPRSPDPTSWWARIAPHAVPFAPAAETAAGEVGEPAIVLRALPHWRGAMNSTPSRPRPLPGTDATRLGEAVHRVLEWAAAPHAPRPPDLRLLARAAADEFGVAAGEVERVASRIWQSPACARFFDPERLRWAGNEVAIADGADVLRIDRLVALAGPPGATTWWVLDYKLQHAPERDAANREQLRRYVAAVRRMQPGDAVLGAFIGGDGELVPLD